MVTDLSPWQLNALQTADVARVCAWAMAEAWPGLVKGQVVTPEGFPRLLELPGHASYALSVPDTSAVGFGQIWVSPNGRTNLVRLLVDPTLRGRGLGKRLCALLLSEALRRPGVSQVFLRVKRDNGPAVAVYRSLGFVEVPAESQDTAMTMVYPG